MADIRTEVFKACKQFEIFSLTSSALNPFNLFLQVMKDLRSNGAAAATDLSKEDIADAMKAKLASSDNENEARVRKNLKNF